MRIEDYEPLDFSKVLKAHKCAIRCDTEQEAIHLLAAMKQQYPSHCRTWDFPDVSWGVYSPIAYSPYLDEEHGSMSYCSVNYYRQTGFTILPFCELLWNSPEIMIDEADFKALFASS